MMSYHPEETYHRMSRHLPYLRYAVRLETAWNELPPPERFVARHTPRLRALADAGHELWVEVGNEPNLELHPHAEATFAEWYREVLRGLRAAVPEARYGFPGLAQGIREEEWLEANAGAIEDSDWLGVHAYWTTEREMLDPAKGMRLLEYHRRFPNLPLIVSEAGNNGHAAGSVERGREYARFVRALARLPYVEAVYFFILYGTPEWRRFFFDDQMAFTVRDAQRDPVSPLARLLGFRPPPPRLWPADPSALAAEDVPLPTPTRAPSRRVEPTPTPAGFARRRLLADPLPTVVAASTDEPEGAVEDPQPAPVALSTQRWTPLPPAVAPAASLRAVNGYTVSDVSARLALAPPVPGAPLAVQVAETDLFAAPGPIASGFALVWDGAGWRLQYRRAGRIETDLPLVDAPGAEGGTAGDGWLQVELALEPRSAAAWVWRRGEPQPARPNAVFAPPEVAALDGARLRSLYLPHHPIADLVFEGGTRFS
jgi:hypothetical protein